MQENPTGIPVVAAALVDACGRVLLQRRPPGKRHAGLWEFPGGKVESKETQRTALVRELHEELGIEVRPDSLKLVAESVDSRADALRDPHVLFLYICRTWTGQPAPEDGAAIGWFSPAEALGLEVPPLDRPLVAALAGLLSAAERNPR